MEEGGRWKKYLVKRDVQDVEGGYVKVAEGDKRICCCGRKVATLKIYLFSATKQDRSSPSLQSRKAFSTSTACSTHCRVELDL